MDSKEIFNRSFRGYLHVTIEKIGSIRVQGLGETIRMIVSSAEAFLSVSSIIDDMRDPCPYELVSFNETEGNIVVRKNPTCPL